MFTVQQLLVGLPAGALLLWGAHRLHQKMFTDASGSGLGIAVLVVMAAMALLLALTLARAFG